MARRKPDQPEENKDLIELGKKVRSGQILSSYLRALASEVTEVIEDDVPKGCIPGPPRLVSKAERLARYIWRCALPHVDDNGMMHEPSLSYVRLLLERIEGKAAVAAEDKVNDGRETVPDKVSRMNAERLNRIAQEAAGDIDA